jgi:multicomponent K+:H+ antiporter subunit A
MTLLPLVAIPLVGSLLPALCARVPGATPARVAALVTAIALAWLLHLGVGGAGLLVESVPWVPALGLSLSFRLDGFSFLFALLILGIGLLVVVYAAYYLGDDEPKARFHGFLLLFMGAMLGVVLSENLLLMVVFWELTGLASFLLIGFWRDKTQARQGARLALLVTGGGGLALLAGVLLLADVAGSAELSVVLAAGDTIRADPRYPLILVLVLGGAFSKSAQFPLHFWLPAAMAAPTPVSAYLHSATLVKAGIYLIGRLHPALSGTDLWLVLVGGAGAITLLTGSFIAMYRHDLKGLLAYSTISHLGLITLLFGLNRDLAAVAAVFHIVNHAVFKASLFMSAGIIDHETGSRDLRRLGGLARLMPQTAALAIVAAAAMAGVPLLNGFLSKEMFLAEAVELGRVGGLGYLPPVLATLASLFTVAYSARFVHDTFFGSGPHELDRVPHDPPPFMRVPVAVLVALCLVVGLAPGLTVQPLLDRAAGAVLQGPLPAYSLALWHGFSAPVLMSLLAFAGGGALYFLSRYRFRLHDYVPARFTGRALTERVVYEGVALLRRVLPRLENGSLQSYTLWLLLASLATGVVAFGGARLTGGIAPQPADAFDWAIASGLCVTAIATVAWHRQRLQALLAMAACGLFVALAFVRFSAPDLALTQLLVEAVTLPLLLLLLAFLPQEGARDGDAGRRLRDGLVAVASGGAVAALSWALLTRPFSSIAGYYLAAARPEGGGHNVVNVILVDFRGFDTLGEITVLAVAATAVLALLRGLDAGIPAGGWAGRGWAADRHPVLLKVMAAGVLPLGLLVAAYLFLRGHNAPGGGFIAGLVAAVALVLQSVALGRDAVAEARPGRGTALLGVGLLVAAATGLGSLAVGRPFLTSAYREYDWPLLGHFELASAMAFDLGVFLVVVGTVLAILPGVAAVPEARR